MSNVPALSQISSPVPSSSTARRPSLRALTLVIPSAQTIARVATPTDTPGHGHPATISTLPDVPPSTPGHGHPALSMLPSAYDGAMTPTPLRMSARATRSSCFSASGADDTHVLARPLPEVDEEVPHTADDEDEHSASAETSRAGSLP